MTDSRDAILYRMVLPDHVCPYGVHALQLLQQAGFAVDDRILATRIEVDALEEELGVDTTPQIFIGEERIGGAEELEAWLERTPA